VVDQDTQEILGAHMVRLESTEVIAQVVPAMEAGIDYRQLLRPHHLHPHGGGGWHGHPLGRPRQECVIDARPNGASGALDRSPRSTAVGAWSHTAHAARTAPDHVTGTSEPL
jgi:Pyridine nucleotide-disulphide oxidoreductase, dimerisation domain